MHIPTLLLMLVGLLGAIDIAYFHTLRGRLVRRPESRRESWIHVARGHCYAAQFLVVPNLKLTGLCYGLLIGLFICDVVIAAVDVLEEPKSRASQGGLSGGEYLMHITLSVLVGAFLFSLFSGTWSWATEPSGIQLVPHAADWIRLGAACMALGALGFSLLEALILMEARMGPPLPIHVRVRLAASVESVWNLTQDHRLHPTWDRRFSRIVMCHQGEHRGPAATPDPRIGPGTLMRYEKNLLGLMISGFGRYKLHRPLQQSTFEFWSDDGRSLISRGVGLWLYKSLPGGQMEFSTSYIYAVRWGMIGRVVDRFLFRPLFQKYTELSFRQLAKTYFDQPRPRVLGRSGRLPQRFEQVTC